MQDVECLIADDALEDAVLVAQLAGTDAGFVLLKDGDNLFLAETTGFHE